MDGDAQWLVVPGDRVGEIRATSTEADLRRAYGDDALIFDPDLLTGTGLIPFGDPASMLDVTWRDAGLRVGVVEVRAAYGAFQWRTAEGLVHGMSLADVARLHGGPVTLEPGGIADLGNGVIVKCLGGRSASDAVLRRYMVGPAWRSDDAEMAAFTATMHVAHLRVVF